jgi:hypothetical protein
MATKKKRINMSVSDELFDKIKRNADRQGLSMPSYCVAFLAQYMDLQEQLMDVTKKVLSDKINNDNASD